MSVYCKDGAVINSIQAQWKRGSLSNKDWEQIQTEFLNENNEFLLGDFKLLAKFLAIAGGDIIRSKSPEQEGEDE